MMTPAEIETRIVVALILSVVIAGAVVLGVHKYNALTAASAQNDQRGRTMVAADGIVSDNSTNLQQRQAVDTGVDVARNHYEEAKRNDPSTADRSVRVFPDSLRNLARERRLARERLARDAGGSESGPGPANAAER